jgi:hypothetical protein
MTYSEKLKNPKWQRKRLEILSRDNFKCSLCGSEEIELHVHHLKYTKEPHNAPDKDLETLCKHCHSLKTFFKEEEYGVFIKSKITSEGIIAMNSKKEISLFTLKEDKIEFFTRFSENNDTLHSLIEFCNEHWIAKI